MTRQFDKLEEVFLNNLMRVFHSIKKDRKKQFVGKGIYITASALFMPKKTPSQPVFNFDCSLARSFWQQSALQPKWNNRQRVEGLGPRLEENSLRRKCHRFKSSDKGQSTIKHLFTGDEGRVPSSAVGPLVPQLYQLWLRLDKILQDRPFVFRRWRPPTESSLRGRALPMGRVR